MSSSPGHRSNTRLTTSHVSPPGLVTPHAGGNRSTDKAVAAAERQTLIGALERVTDRRPGLPVPETLYTDPDANVAWVLRTHVLCLLSANAVSEAAETCTAVVRLMALQPARRWLDSRLVLRVALIAHECGHEAATLLPAVRELTGARSRWHAAVLRHGGEGDLQESEDWALTGELNALPPTFSPKLRALIAQGIARQDVDGVRSAFARHSRRHHRAAGEARGLLSRHAPLLSSLYGAQLTSRVMRPSRHVPRPAAREARWPSATLGLLVFCGIIGTALTTHPTAAQEQPLGAAKICEVVGDGHESCHTASSLDTNLRRGECAMASEALPMLEQQLSNFGLNRELAIIRANELGELGEPFEALKSAYDIRCD